jgi:hypothetical protein
MVREHFPGSLVTDSQASPPPRGTELKVEPISWVTPERTWAAINSFGPHKACGTDKLGPVVLQHLPREAEEALSNIFTDVIELGYVCVCVIFCISTSSQPTVYELVIKATLDTSA